MNTLEKDWECGCISAVAFTAIMKITRQTIWRKQMFIEIYNFFLPIRIRVPGD